MKKIIIIAVVLIVVIGIPLTKKMMGGSSEKLVNVEALSHHQIRSSILASGQFIHENQVKLTAEVIGKVSALYAKEGDWVKEGQLLLELDDETYRAAVEQQEAVVDQQSIAIERQKLVLANLQSQWQRKQKLFKKGLLDKDNFDLISNQLEIAKVDLKSSREQLKQAKAILDQSLDRLAKTKIRSPISGRITSLDIKVGETAISGTTNIVGSSLMTIADPKSMLAEVYVDEADIAKVKLGLEAEIIAIAFENKPVKGKVNFIASSAKNNRGQQNLSFSVKLDVAPDESIHLRPGMTCRAEIFTSDDKGVLAVSQRAVKTDEDNDTNKHSSYVFKLDNGKAVKTEIDTGISDDTYIEVLSGLSASEQVIVGPDKILRHLKDGEPVEAEEIAESTSAKDAEKTATKESSGGPDTAD